jgi:hypothetical protein
MGRGECNVILMGFIVVLILICGCTSSEIQQPTNTALPTSPLPMESVPIETIATISTLETPVPTVTEDIVAQQESIDANWREIRHQWDIYYDKRNRLFGEQVTNDDVNFFRQEIVPDAITNFTKLKSELGMIESSDPKIIGEKENLTKICDYKLYHLEASSAYFHGYQLESMNRKTAIDEYRNAKYAYQDALGIINSFDDESQYYPYISGDILDLNNSIANVDQKLTQLST